MPQSMGWRWGNSPSAATSGPVVHVVLDRLAVGDQLVDRRLVLQRAPQGQLGGLVVGAVHVLLVELGILGAARVDPHQADDAQVVDLVLRDQALDHAVEDRIGGRALHHAAEQVDVGRVAQRDLGTVIVAGRTSWLQARIANIAVWPLLWAIMLAKAWPTGPSVRPIRISGIASVNWPSLARTVASPAWKV